MKFVPGAYTDVYLCFTRVGIFLACQMSRSRRTARIRTVDANPGRTGRTESASAKSVDIAPFFPHKYPRLLCGCRQGRPWPCAITGSFVHSFSMYLLMRCPGKTIRLFAGKLTALRVCGKRSRDGSKVPIVPRSLLYPGESSFALLASPPPLDATEWVRRRREASWSSLMQSSQSFRRPQ